MGDASAVAGGKYWRLVEIDTIGLCEGESHLILSGFIGFRDEQNWGVGASIISNFNQDLEDLRMDRIGVLLGVGNCDHFRINRAIQILQLQTIPASST